MKKIVETIPLLLMGAILPLIARLDLILTWPVLTVIAYGVLLNLTQPVMSFKKDSTNAHDRNSMLLILISTLLCFVIPLVDYAYGKTKMIELSQSSSIVGLLMIWGGLLFRAWSIRVLDRFFTAKVVIQSDHQLIRTGPYQYLRHPSYLGAWVSQVGLSLFLQSVYGLIFSVIINFVIYIYRIHCEEKALIEMFPNEYPEYKNTTSGILPFIY